MLLEENYLVRIIAVPYALVSLKLNLLLSLGRVPPANLGLR